MGSVTAGLRCCEGVLAEGPSSNALQRHAELAISGFSKVNPMDLVRPVGTKLNKNNRNEERRADGASPLWQAGTAAQAEIGTCLPWERGADPRAAVKRQNKSSGFRGIAAGTVVSW